MNIDKFISTKAMKTEEERNKSGKIIKGQVIESTNPLVLDCKMTLIECISILEKKNADYASESDPLKNFNASEIVGVDRERAILVRIMDKISRISNLLDRDPLVKDESLEDTINDAINYLAILKFVRKQIK